MEPGTCTGTGSIVPESAAACVEAIILPLPGAWPWQSFSALQVNHKGQKRDGIYESRKPRHHFEIRRLKTSDSQNSRFRFSSIGFLIQILLSRFWIMIILEAAQKLILPDFACTVYFYHLSIDLLYICHCPLFWCLPRT
jgi:hypothetical protein